MPGTNPSSSPSRRWQVAGLSLALIAVGLGATGTLLAIRQAWWLTHRVMDQARLRAGQIAAQVSDQFEQRLEATMRSIAIRLADKKNKLPQKSLNLPVWIELVAQWNGHDLRILVSPTPEDQRLAEFLEAHVRTRSALLPPVSSTARLDMHHERWSDRPIVIATLPGSTVDITPRHVVAVVNPWRAVDEFVGPLVAADEALGVAPSSQAPGSWDFPLPGALRDWSIRPTETFVRNQRNTVLAQTLLHVGVTTLALATLLVVMWLMLRVVRREIALAELKANFVADVSHELKTPLALIHLYAETIQSGRVSSEQKRQEYYDIIMRESTRLTNLINNILDFARIEAGRKEFTLQAVDAATVVRETYEAYRAQLDHSGFDHNLVIEPSTPAVTADRDAIAQILVNLMNNAIKYSDDDKYLLIEVAKDTRRGRHGVLMSVHDRGIGIRPEDRAMLTEGFYRSKDARVRGRSGTGLGLALVRHMVEAHGGSFDVESRLVKGSTFRVFLPADEPSGVRSSTAESTQGAKPLANGQ